MHSGSSPRGEAPTTPDFVPLKRWLGIEITVGMNFEQNRAVVDDSDRSSDWTAIKCTSNDAAQFLAAHIWVSP